MFNKACEKTRKQSINREPSIVMTSVYYNFPIFNNFCMEGQIFENGVRSCIITLQI